MKKPAWNVTIGWRASDAFGVVRAWTKRGAIKEGYKLARILKPRADVQFVGVCDGGWKR